MSSLNVLLRPWQGKSRMTRLLNPGNVGPDDPVPDGREQAELAGGAGVHRAAGSGVIRLARLAKV